MVSPLVEISINAGAYESTVGGADIAAGNTVSFRLASTAGVRSWSFLCTSSDETSDVDVDFNDDLVIANYETNTFTSSATAGKTYIFTSTVNGGVDPNGTVQTSYTTTFIVYILADNGRRVLAFDETVEGGEFGWVEPVNVAIRDIGGGGGGGGGSLLAAYYVDGQNSSGLASDANTGASALLPLRTGRRLSILLGDTFLTQNTTVYVMSEMQANDDWSLFCNCEQYSLTFVGTRTSVGSGTSSAATNLTASATATWEDTSKAAGYFATFATASYHIETATSIFPVWESLGASNCTIGPPKLKATVPATILDTAPADGSVAAAQAYTIYQLPKIAMSNFGTGLNYNLIFQHVELENQPVFGNGVFLQTPIDSILAFECGFSGSTGFAAWTPISTQYLVNCRTDCTLLLGLGYVYGGVHTGFEIVGLAPGFQVDFDAVMDNTVLMPWSGILQMGRAYINGNADSSAWPGGPIIGYGGRCGIVVKRYDGSTGLVYGPGTLRIHAGDYLQYTGTAVAVFTQVGGIELEGGRQAFAQYDDGSFTALRTVTPALLDTSLAGGGFNGQARTNKGTTVCNADTNNGANAGSGVGTLAGDVTGPIGTTVVEKVHGATVPIAGALTTGNVPQVSGASALSYGPINLAGGANYVTGTLPVGSLPAMGGDVTGTVAASVAEKLTGDGSNIVKGTFAGLTYGETVAAFSMKQATRTTDAATAPMTFEAQAPFASSTGTNQRPGSFLFKIADPANATSSDVNSRLGVFFSGTERLRAWWDENSSYVVLDTPGSDIFQINVALNSLYLKANGNILLSSQDAFVFYNYALVEKFSISTTDNKFHFGKTLTAAGVIHDPQTTDTAPTNLTIETQAPFATATGTNRRPGSLLLKIADPAGSTASDANSRVGVFFSGTEKFRIWNDEVNVGVVLDVPSADALTIDVASSAMYLKCNGNMYFSPNGDHIFRDYASTELFRLSTSGQKFLFANQLTTAGITHTAQTTDTATTDFTITSQAPWASATGTNRNASKLVYVVPAATSGGTVGYHRFDVEGAEQFRVGSGFASMGAIPASTGRLRLPTNSTIYARNSGNTSDIPIIGMQSNAIEIGDSSYAASIFVYASGFVGYFFNNGAAYYARSTLVSGSTGPSIVGSGSHTFQLSVEARTSDAATQLLHILGHTPYASATGANRNPGNVLVEVPSPVSGGTSGLIRSRVSGTDITEVQSDAFALKQGLRRHVRVVSASDDVDPNDDVIIVSGHGAGITLELDPAIAGHQVDGVEFSVFNDSPDYTTTLNSAGGKNIHSDAGTASSLVLTGRVAARLVYSATLENWYVIGDQP